MPEPGLIGAIPSALMAQPAAICGGFGQGDSILFEVRD
jgi:hypothetical protein